MSTAGNCCPPYRRSFHLRTPSLSPHTPINNNGTGLQISLSCGCNCGSILIYFERSDAAGRLDPSPRQGTHAPGYSACTSPLLSTANPAALSFPYTRKTDWQNSVQRLATLPCGFCDSFGSRHSFPNCLPTFCTYPQTDTPCLGLSIPLSLFPVATAYPILHVILFPFYLRSFPIG